MAMGLVLTSFMLATAAPVSANCDNYGNQVNVGSETDCTVNQSYCDGTGGSGAGSGAGAGAGGGVSADETGAEASASSGTSTNCCSGTEHCNEDGTKDGDAVGGESGREAPMPIPFQTDATSAGYSNGNLSFTTPDGETSNFTA